MRQVIAWLLGRDELTRLEALRVIERAEVIRPQKHARQPARSINLIQWRDARRKVA